MEPQPFIESLPNEVRCLLSPSLVISIKNTVLIDFRYLSPSSLTYRLARYFHSRL